jgi:hypothetical protein
VRVTVWCRSEDFAEEISEEEGLDVVHILEVSKCQQKNYGRPSKKPRGATKKPARWRRSPPREPLLPATVAPPSLQSPGSKIDAALASPDAPPPPQSPPDEPAALPEWESRFL